MLLRQRAAVLLGQGAARVPRCIGGAPIVPRRQCADPLPAETMLAVNGGRAGVELERQPRAALHRQWPRPGPSRAVLGSAPRALRRQCAATEARCIGDAPQPSP
ncbi:hypothetical protein [Kribbella sp. ALI-6-A]|uniref:hypothetical protein n=1 Tax=Kribbella sp. ALI-6-A TaxID=1933817 RepID=UPI00117A82AB|nr:hypothetical protein [Kribbella sp. ALI-6-A]